MQKLIIQAKFISIVFFISFSTYHSFGQNKGITLSGLIKDQADLSVLSYVNIVLKTEKDSAFVTGTVSNEEGRFTLSNIKPSNYFLEISYIGYVTKKQSIYVGSLSEFLDVATIELNEEIKTLDEVVISAKQDEVGSKMDKKTFKVEDNINQTGGSVLQTMQNLPGVTVQDGKVQLRGNDKVTVLIDGKQTALTGFGSQSG